MTLSHDIPQASSSSTGKQPVIPAPVHTTRQTTRRAAAAAAAAAISNARSSRTHQVQFWCFNEFLIMQIIWLRMMGYFMKNFTNISNHSPQSATSPNNKPSSSTSEGGRKTSAVRYEIQ